MWNYILDGAIVLILLVSFIAGCSMGFAKTFVKLLGGIFSVVCSILLSEILAEKIRFWFEPYIVDRVQGFVNGIPINSLTNSVEGILSTENLAESSNIIEKLFALWVDKQDLSSKIIGGTGTLKQNVTFFLTNDVAIPVFTVLLQIIIFIIVFAILMILLKIIMQELNLLDHLPVINAFNRFLGGLIGIVKGIIWIILFVMVVQLIMIFAGIDAQIINDTCLLKYLYNIIPFKVIEL